MNRRWTYDEVVHLLESQFAILPGIYNSIIVYNNYLLYIIYVHAYMYSILLLYTELTSGYYYYNVMIGM